MRVREPVIQAAGRATREKCSVPSSSHSRLFSNGASRGHFHGGTTHVLMESVIGSRKQIFRNASNQDLGTAKNASEQKNYENDQENSSHSLNQ